MKKTLFLLTALIILSGCYQNSAMLGPAITVGATGNIYQAGFSYGVNHTLEKTTGKTTLEHFTSFVDKKEKYIKEKQQQKEDLIKKLNAKIEATRGNLLIKK